MLKQAYVRVAQAAPSLFPNGHSAYSPGAPHRSLARRWFASLGAIYHLDRMIGLDIPWWNVAATTDVAAFLQRTGNARVFEYGSGASTLWLARRAASVTSVEHDAAWANKLSRATQPLPNVSLHVASYDSAGAPADQPYVRAIEGTGDYDLIVVDGRLRTACLATAIPHLKLGGIIVFDDSGRERYRSAITTCGLAETHYHGLSYCVPYPDHTSILTNGPWPPNGARSRA
ncbi:MAG: class I SAM-dependent methyltransferase [Alphaproteobacteria bacterium]|nr:class I SAM-dependent methyltransferase [Alphaproteobacteria bacterium]